MRIIPIIGALISLLIVTLVGFIDDLLVNRSKDRTSGLKQWQKPLLTAAAAIPLMVVNAGNSIMWFPFIGEVNFGLIYPLILIPLIFIGSSNMVNILAGFNGLEAGLGLIYIGNLGVYAFLNNKPLT